MDNPDVRWRGWREFLATDHAIPEGKRKEFSGVIEKYLLSMEQHGWEVAVETMKGYLEMA